MRRRARFALVLLMVLAAGCRTVPGSRSDVESLLKVVLAEVEGGRGTVTIVPGAKLDPKVTAVARTMRSVEVRSDLPEKHLRLDRVAISGDTAAVDAWVGPIPQPKEGEILLACGTGYQWTFERIAAAPYWKVKMVGIAVC